MTDTTDTPAEYTGPDYGFGDDNALAHEIASFDPLADTAGPFDLSRMAQSNSSPTPSLDALPPAMQAPIIAELGSLSGERRAEREAELVYEALWQNSLDLRVAAGPGRDADPFQRTFFDLHNRLRLIDQEETRLKAELDVVNGYRTVYHPETGEPSAVPIMSLSGGNRVGAQNRLAELAQQRALIQGSEGRRESQEALAEAVAQRKSFLQHIDEREEAKRRSASQDREARINAMAETYSKSKRNTLG